MIKYRRLYLWILLILPALSSLSLSGQESKPWYQNGPWTWPVENPKESQYWSVDWHSIGNLEMELFQDPMYNTSQQETYQFWRTISNHFKGNNTLAFYDIFNEPTLYRGQLGSMSWAEWKKINENVIHLIRAYDPETIPLVAGFMIRNGARPC